MQQPETEEWLAGAGLQVSGQSNGVVISGRTESETGPYCFDALPPDTYTVREENPSGYRSTTVDLLEADVLADTTISLAFGDVLVGQKALWLPLILQRFERSD